MQIKKIKPEYKEELKKLLTFCFGIRDDDLDRFIESIYNPEDCYGVFEKDKLAASLTIIPYDIFYNDSIVSMGGISAVSTFPEYRNRHFARELLVKSLQIMYERGDYFSFLNPFSYSFYRKYGWETCLQYKNYNIDIEKFKKFSSCNQFNFKKLSSEDKDKMNKVYEKFVKKYNGPVKRSPKIWEVKFEYQQAENKYRFGCWDEKETLQGYIVFKLKNEEYIKIDELCYTSPEVKKEIFRFIYSLRAQINQVKWRPAGDDNTMMMLSDPAREHELSLGMMWRIIDVKKVLESYNFADSLNTSFTLKVEDSYADWNQGIFLIDINEGEVEVKRTERSEYEVFSTIQTLSQLVSGYIELEERKILGGIEGETEALKTLDKFVPAKNTFLNDYF